MSAENFDIPRTWRLKQQRYALIGEVCGECDTKIFPPRDLCPECGRQAHEPFKFSGKGKIYSFTKVLEAPQGYEGQTPYYLAMVTLDEGPMVTAQLTDFDRGHEPKIGMKVEMVTRLLKVHGSDERGLFAYGYKFRPPVVAEASHSLR